MKTVKLPGRSIDIPLGAERVMRHLQENGWIARISDFETGYGRHKKNDFVHNVEQMNLGYYIGVSRRVTNTTSSNKRLAKWSKANRQCRYAVVGNPRRINAILKQIDKAA